MSKKAMTLALESLRKAQRQFHYYNIAPHLAYQDAIKALEEALAKQEQGEPDDEVLGFNGWGFPIERPPKREQCGTCKGKLCIGEGSKDDPIRSCPSCNPKALAKQEHGSPEDMYIEMHKHLNCPHCGGSGHIDDVKQEQGEPVAYFNPQVKGGFYWAKPTKITAPITVSVEPMPLYTTPQPAQKPLSEAAIEGLAKFVAVDDFNYDFARAIEKAHGIKENT